MGLSERIYHQISICIFTTFTNDALHPFLSYGHGADEAVYHLSIGRSAEMLSAGGIVVMHFTL
jgi:hypothetical protein